MGVQRDADRGGFRMSDIDTCEAGDGAEDAMRELDILRRRCPGISQVSWCVALIFAATKEAQGTTLDKGNLTRVMESAFEIFPWKPRDVTPEVEAAIERIMGRSSKKGPS